MEKILLKEIGKILMMIMIVVRMMMMMETILTEKQLREKNKNTMTL